MADDLTAALQPFQLVHRQHVSRNFPEPGICAHDRDHWPCDSARLLAAIEAVLKLADDWDAKRAQLKAAAAATWSTDEAAMLDAAAEIRENSASALREAITAELTGKEEP